MRKTVLALGAVIGLAAPSVHAADPVPITVETIRPGLLRLEQPTPFGPVNVVASVGKDGVLLVDTGLAANGEALRAAVDKLGHGPVRVIILTHGHGDHTGGTASFGADPVVVAPAAVRQGMTSGYGLLAEPPAAALPDLTFEEGLTLHFNGEEIRVRTLGGGHTSHDAIVSFSGSQVVALGGLLYADRFPFVDVGGGCRPDRLAEHLRTIASSYPAGTVLVPGHGRLLTMADVAAYGDMVTRSSAAVKAAVDRGLKDDALRQSGALDTWTAWERPFLSKANWADAVARSLDPGAQPRQPPVVGLLYRAYVEGGLEAATAEYRRLKAKDTPTFDFGEGNLNALGYYALGKGKARDAVALFELNAAENPESWNVWDSLAEGLAAAGEKERAVDMYRKSLAINPGNQNATAKLQELGAK